jgi:hypothetical protein
MLGRLRGLPTRRLRIACRTHRAARIALPVVRGVLAAQDGGMGEIVNLHRAKQRRARQEAAVTAKQNRVRHGRTGAAKSNERRAEERRQARLDALRRGVTDE